MIKSKGNMKKNRMALLKKTGGIVQNSAVDWEGLKKQSCLKVCLVYLQHERNECVHRLWWPIISMHFFQPSSQQQLQYGISPQLLVCTRALCFSERSLHLFSRCGDGSCWESFVAAFTCDPLGQPWNTAAALIASCRLVLFVDFHLATHTNVGVNTTGIRCTEKMIANTGSSYTTNHFL